MPWKHDGQFTDGINYFGRSSDHLRHIGGRKTFSFTSFVFNQFFSYSKVLCCFRIFRICREAHRNNNENDVEAHRDNNGNDVEAHRDNNENDVELGSFTMVIESMKFHDDQTLFVNSNEPPPSYEESVSPEQRASFLNK